MNVRVAIIGVGLIGGSLGLRLRRTGFASEVIGCGRGRDNLETALARGCIDRYVYEPRAAVRGADLVVIATPVETIGAVLRDVADELDATTVVTDAGSVKVSVAAAARQHLGAAARRFVPGHPIAGTENSGAAAADAELFAGKRWLLTPAPGRRGTAAGALATVRAMVEATGARLELLDPAEHDRIYGWVSHLPHFLAFALAGAIAGRDPDDLLRGGGGLRDFLRIAASDPVMWADVFRHNRKVVRRALREFSAEARALANLIDDEPALRERLAGISGAVRAARARS